MTDTNDWLRHAYDLRRNGRLYVLFLRLRFRYSPTPGFLIDG